MNHLNYCRQLVQQFKAMAAVPNIEPEKRAVVEHVVDLCRASQKFMLPEGGELLHDAGLRALDDTQPLRLPHPFVALEYQVANPALPKRIIFCREDDDGIYVRPAIWVQSEGFWRVKRDAFIPRMDYLDRSNPKEVIVKAEYQSSEEAESTFGQVVVVLGVLNALQCSNVRIERSEPRQAGKKVKAALPFDAYHVLTVDVGGKASPRSGSDLNDTSHRSPREHLRRGHIVRPEGRRPYWRNATVVNAGRGFGRADKDYRLKLRGFTP